MGNGVLHSKHQKRAKPTPPSPSIPRLVGEKPRGRGVLFSPPHVHPLGPRPPKAPRSLKLGGGGERGPPRFPLPLNCTLLLGCSQVPPAPSPPAPPSPPTQQSTLPAPGGPHEGARFCPRPVLAGGTRGDPAPARPLPAPARHAARALRGPGRALPPPSPRRKRSGETRPGDSSGPRAHASPERLRADGAGHWPGGHHLRSAPSPRPSVRSYIPGKSPPLRL